MSSIEKRFEFDETDDEDTVVKKFIDWLETMSSSERDEVKPIIQAFMNELEICMLRLRDGTVYALKGR